MAKAKKKTVNGIQFDSITEADYYQVLLDRQKSGEISNLECQPEFEILKPFKIRSRKIRGMRYTPDFMYEDKLGTHVVEVKGYAKPDYMMRRKLFLYMYGDGYIFHEVKRKGKLFSKSTW